MLNWIDWLTFEIIESMSEPEKRDLACINSAMYSVAAVTSFKDGQEFRMEGAGKPTRKTEEPKWKKRLENKIMGLRKEADILSAYLENKIRREEAQNFLESVVRKYRIDGSRASIMKTLFLVKENISVFACRIRRYEKRLKSRIQNETFRKDKKAFYRSIFEDSNKVEVPPDTEDIRKFWSEKIWGNAEKYTEKPSWYQEVEKNYSKVKEQSWDGISKNEINNQLMKSMNWKAPGVDYLSNFWLKNMPSSFPLLAESMNSFVAKPELLPDWVVRGRTTLLPKSNKTSDATQYRPITCLGTDWKCLSGILSEQGQHL